MRSSHPRPPYNPGVHALVAGKQAGHFRPSPAALKAGFAGWHERGYLPHCDAPGTMQCVTWMLQDSFPATRHRDWMGVLDAPRGNDNDDLRRKLEAWLDRGHGACWLRDSSLADCVWQSLCLGHGTQYRLLAGVIMPNHVHVAVAVESVPLRQIVQRWKGASAREANRLLHRSGAFWAADYFDTRIRNAAHLRQVVRYVESNPAKAGLVRDPADWPWSTARLRDRYGQLPGKLLP